MCKSYNQRLTFRFAQNAGIEVSTEAPHPVPGIRHQNIGIINVVNYQN